MKKEVVKLWALAAEDVFKHVGSSEKGLSSKTAEERIAYFGKNEIGRDEKRHALGIFFSQFKNSLVLVLIFAAIISYFVGEHIGAAIILSIILLSSLMGFIQEFKAERALKELRKYIRIKAKVLRDNAETETDSRELVPGDIIFLEHGDVVPADIRLLKVEQLTTDESSLTGESLPVLKIITTVSEERSVPQYLRNIAFMGTTVASGSGYGVVISTGNDTFFGKTASFLQQKEPETDFQKNIRFFSNFLLKVTVAMTVFVFIANALLGKGFFISLIFALALGVGITPEMLPIIITITLSNGALKMAKEKVVIKRLASVEDLGNMDVLCCDKTGTLTEGSLHLEDHINLDGDRDEKILFYGLLCNSGVGKRHKKITDDLIDKAIWLHKSSDKLESVLKRYSIIKELKFDFVRRMMSVLASSARGSMIIVKGAPESVIKASKFAVLNGKKCRLDKHTAEKIMERVSFYEEKGYRVIAVAEKQLGKKKVKNYQEKALTAAGFLIFLDPPKKTVRSSLEKFQKLGVLIKIITGDSPVVTKKVCEEVALDISGGRVITGDELEKLDKKSFERYCKKYNVFCRVTPEQKFMIVTALKEEGHVVGFLGDGINDSPALRECDVGISVQSAVGVAKESADIILLEKSLHILADGIVSGRRTFSNITKYISNTISANWGNMFTVALSSVFMKFIPLLPAQILLNNFLSDVPNLTISTDNVDEQHLKRPERWNIKFISKFMVFFGFISSFFDLLLIIPLLYIFKADADTFRTAWFVESLISEVIIVFAIRTILPFFKSKPSRWLIWTSALTIVAAIILPYIIFADAWFSFVALPYQIFGYIFFVLLLYFITAEYAKRYFFKKWGFA